AVIRDRVLSAAADPAPAARGPEAPARGAFLGTSPRPPEPYDCQDDGLESWQTDWSAGKMAWCCEDRTRARLRRAPAEAERRPVPAPPPAPRPTAAGPNPAPPPTPPPLPPPVPVPLPAPWPTA
ncbi:unnamed protein product, partial [Prorocentrum cordatum]